MANMKRKANSIKRIFPLSLIVFFGSPRVVLICAFHLLTRVLRQWLRPKMKSYMQILKLNCNLFLFE
jgi:hypothetical protein